MFVAPRKVRWGVSRPSESSSCDRLCDEKRVRLLSFVCVASFLLTRFSSMASCARLTTKSLRCLRSYAMNGFKMNPKGGVMTRQTVVFAKYAAQLVPLWEGDGLELLLLDRLLEEAYLVLIHAELAQHALDFFSAEVARTVRVSIDKGLEQVRLGEQAFGLLHEAQADAEHRDDQREDGARARGVQHKNHGVLVALREHLVRDV